jgi:3-dehydroquinate dehydratase II
MKILILNGPNLNLLGKRQPEIYGNLSFEDYFHRLQKDFPNHELVYFQSNHEGALIDFLQENSAGAMGLVINAGGLTHTSVSLADSVANLTFPSVEVHISNVFAREEFRRYSCLSPVCKGLISGLGLTGYSLAISYLSQTISS